MIESQNHPDFEELLLLVDDSVPSRSNRWVRKHVAACWKCRSHLEDLQETVREFARYHEKVLLPGLPAPPKPWPELRSRMRQMDEANPMPDLWSRVYAYMALPGVLSFKRLMIGGIVFSVVALAVTLVLKTEKHSEAAPVSSPRIAPAVEPSPTPLTAVPNRAVKTSPAMPSAADTEVRIFAALHRIDADLGDPIEISSDSKGNFTVLGIGLASPRQAEVRDALRPLPDVAVTFSQAGPATGAPSSRALNFEAGRSPFEAPLVRLLGGQGEWESYANQVLDESDAVLIRAHALQTLADHFPAAKRAELHDPERAMLDEISDAHRAAFREHARKLESLVAPVREALNAPALAAGKGTDRPLDSAQRMDRVLSVIFGVASTNLTPHELIRELSEASAGLQEKPE
jgi:hypothetical protein